MKSSIIIAAACAAMSLGAANVLAQDVPLDGTAEVKAQEITVWVNPLDPVAVKNVYARFTEATGVKVNIVEMPSDGFEAGVQTRWASGERPDVLEYHATSLFWALNPVQNMYDLSAMPYVAHSGDILKFSGSLNGVVYAAITDTPSLFGLFYNRKVLADIGAEIPKTFADLEAICLALKEKDPSIAPIWESGGSSWPTQILGGLMYMGSAQQSENWAQRVMDKETTFGAEGSPFLAGLTEYKKLQDMGCFNGDATTARFEDGIPAVSEGRAAMIALPTGLLDMFYPLFDNDKAKTAETIGFAYPSADNAVAIWAPNVAGTWYVPKTGDADRESTALAFIQFATGEGYQAFVDEKGTYPVLDTATAPTAEYISKELDDAFAASSAFAFNSNLSGFNAEFGNYMTGLLAGTETPESIARKAQVVFEQAAKLAGLPGW